MSNTGAELVACKYCGSVYDLRKASELVRCPVCDTGGDRTNVPRHGTVNKWWDRL